MPLSRAEKSSTITPASLWRRARMAEIAREPAVLRAAGGLAGHDLAMRILVAAPILCLLACGSPAPEQGVACPAPRAGPTTHPAATLSGDVTWSADASPHVITGDVTVPAGATLTLEPCAQVTIAENHYLTVKGKLTATGTAGKPITIAQKDAGKRWASIEVSDPGSASLAYVTISGGGGLGNTTAGASLRVYGQNVVPIVKPLFVDHVTVKDSAGPGVLLTDTAGFADGSKELTITQTGSAPVASALSGPMPLRVNLNALGTIPSGNYTGNAADEIEIVGDAPSSALGVDATLRNRGVPYHVGGRGGNPELRVSDDKGGLATLTIEPGVELRFEKDARFEIGHFTGNDAPRGVLVAVGTPDKHIVFTSAAATPLAGDWPGLRYVNTLSPNNKLEYVEVKYAGGDCGCSGFSCGPTISTGVTDDAAILLFNQAPSAFIKNCKIEKSASHGISRGWRGTVDPSFLADGTNTFTDVAGCNETYPKDPNGGCPANPPCPK